MSTNKPSIDSVVLKIALKFGDNAVNAVNA